MQHNEHKRVKFGAEPGDVSLRRKIAMREGDTRNYPPYITDEIARGYKKELALKAKKVQRRRDKRAIQESIDNV